METLSHATPPHADYQAPAAPVRAPGPFTRVRLDLGNLARFWPVIHNMVLQDLRLRYHRSVLGFLWSLLNPILMMATLTVVFSQLLNRGASEYAVYLFAGMLPWTLFASTLHECTYCIITNEGLIRKIYLPKMLFPITRLLTNLCTFVLSLTAMFILMVPLGTRFHSSMLALPLAIALLAAFTLGLGLIVATANTYYRDLSHLVGVILQAWYFATPILYELDIMPAELRWRFWLNPAFPFIRMFQTILYEGRWPEPSLCLIATTVAAVVLGAGYAAFKCYEDKLIFRL